MPNRPCEIPEELVKYIYSKTSSNFHTVKPPRVPATLSIEHFTMCDSRTHLNYTHIHTYIQLLQLKVWCLHHMLICCFILVWVSHNGSIFQATTVWSIYVFKSALSNICTMSPCYYSTPHLIYHNWCLHCAFIRPSFNLRITLCLQSQSDNYIMPPVWWYIMHPVWWLHYASNPVITLCILSDDYIMLPVWWLCYASTGDCIIHPTWWEH